MADFTALLLLVTTLAGAACRGGARDAGATVVNSVDSVVPRDEAILRFRNGLVETNGLRGGAGSRAELVRRFVTALEARDTAALRGLAVTRAEFAFVYYPTTPQARPPYDLSPSLMWFMLEQHSLSGLAHALEERGGQPLRVAGHECVEDASREGLNTVWGPCLLHRVQTPGDTIRERLFGQIIERGGRYKFLSYANKL